MSRPPYITQYSMRGQNSVCVVENGPKFSLRECFNTQCWPVNFTTNDGKTWDYLGRGTYNTVYKSGDIVWKLQHDEPCETDAPTRSVRVWNEVHSAIRNLKRAAPTAAEYSIGLDHGWTAPFINGLPPSDQSAVCRALINVYNRTRRIIIDAETSDYENFVNEKGKKNPTPIDFGMAPRLEKKLAKIMSQVSLDDWAKERDTYTDWLEKAQKGCKTAEKKLVINTVKALLYIETYHLELATLAILNKPGAIETLAEAFDQKNWASPPIHPSWLLTKEVIQARQEKNHDNEFDAILFENRKYDNLYTLLFVHNVDEDYARSLARHPCFDDIYSEFLKTKEDKQQSAESDTAILERIQALPKFRSYVLPLFARKLFEKYLDIFQNVDNMVQHVLYNRLPQCTDKEISYIEEGLKILLREHTGKLGLKSVTDFFSKIFYNVKSPYDILKNFVILYNRYTSNEAKTALYNLFIHPELSRAALIKLINTVISLQDTDTQLTFFLTHYAHGFQDTAYFNAFQKILFTVEHTQTIVALHDQCKISWKTACDLSAAFTFKKNELDNMDNAGITKAIMSRINRISGTDLLNQLNKMLATPDEKESIIGQAVTNRQTLLLELRPFIHDTINQYIQRYMTQSGQPRFFKLPWINQELTGIKIRNALTLLQDTEHCAKLDDLINLLKKCIRTNNTLQTRYHKSGEGNYGHALALCLSLVKKDVPIILKMQM